MGANFGWMLVKVLSDIIMHSKLRVYPNSEFVIYVYMPTSALLRKGPLAPSLIFKAKHELQLSHAVC